MKKKIVLILVTLMCISLCACGGSEPTSNNENKVVEQNNEKGEATVESEAGTEGDKVEVNGETGEKVVIQPETETSLEKVEETTEQQTTTEQQVKDWYELEISDLEEIDSGVYFIKSELVAPHIKVVELTLDNWSEYFEDYHYVEHKVETEKNAFGDIVSQKEYDVERHGFGIKDKYIAWTKDVALQFEGRTYYIDFDIYFEQLKSEDSWTVYLEDKIIGKVNNGAVALDREYVNLELEEGVYCHSYIDVMVQGGGLGIWPSDYIVSGDFPKVNECYTDYECTRVQGTLALVEVPENLKEIIDQTCYVGENIFTARTFDWYLNCYLGDYLEGKSENK